MREIKFRGKVKYNGNHYFSGQWVYGHFYSEGDDKFYILDCSEDQYGNVANQWVEVDSETVGQYIGQRDCKRTEEFPEGQEIYEGDIDSDNRVLCLGEYEYSENNGQYSIDEKRVGWYWKGLEWGSCSDYSTIYGEFKPEIIGNIHEEES